MNDSNFLFVCSRNQWRSPTAEKVLVRKGLSARSVGTSPKAKRTISVRDICWASHIFVMEKKHKHRVQAMYPRLTKYKKIIVLDIPDEYKYMDPELIVIIETAMAQYTDE